MKFMKKKVLGLVASIAMVLSLFVLPVSVNATNEKVAKIGDKEYETLAMAVQEVVNSESKTGTVTLLKDTSGGGIGLFNGKGAEGVNLTIDFGGHTYTCTDPAVGSVGTESQGFHLEKGNEVTLKNGSITVSSDSNNTIMLIQNYCNLTLENLNLNGSSATQYIISSNYGDTVLKNVSINGTHNNLVAIDLMHWLVTPYKDKAPTMSIENTSQEVINGDIKVYCGGTGSESCEQKPNLEIHGGTYNNTKALKYLQSGRQITVDLNSDVKDDLVVPAKTTVTLNLNGHTITNDSDHTIINNGTLDINGEGTIDNITHGKAAIYNELGATATLNGGTYTRSEEKGSNSTNNGGNSYYNIVNHGKMTINENVVVEQNGKFSSLLENGWYDGTQNTNGTPSELTINGGTFSGGLNTIKNDDYGKLIINNGTFENVSQAVLSNWNIAEVNGGTFTSVNSNVILNGKLDNIMDQGILTIKGGKFVAAEGKAVIAKMGGGNDESLKEIKITGGTFSFDVKTYVAEGYKTYLVDNNYKVVPKTTGIELSDENINIAKGNAVTLTATLKPEGAIDEITWSSDDSKVATVDANGKVTAIGAGKATITATAGNKTATCEVTVYEVESDVEAPVIDTSKPVDEVTVGINDKESQQNISDTMTSIVDGIINKKEVTSVSGKTVENIKNAINEGKVISTEVQVTPVKETEVNAQDKKVLEDHIDQNVNIAQYLDINILVKANNQVIGEINQLNKEITFTVAIPEDLMKEGRTFYVIRVHDGKAEKLETVENEDGTLTFKTDKFSTYALAYEDAQDSTTTPIQPGQSQDDIKGETVVTPDNNQQVTNTQNTQETTKEPKTGDTSNIALYGAMALISLGLVGAIVLKKKVSEK